VELIKSAITCIDIYGMKLVQSWDYTRVGDKQARILGVGLGWAGAEAFFAHFVIFVVNASGGEFSWEYFQRAIESNLASFQMLAFAALVAVLFRGSGLTRTLAIVVLAAKIFALPMVIEFALNAGIVDTWLSLLAQGAFTIVFLLGAKVLNELNS
jgi:hypothetical protein